MSNFYENLSLKRIILAFLIAPWAIPLVFMAVEVIDGTFYLNRILPSLYLGLPAYLVTAIFGIPAYFLYRALKWSNILLFVLGGGIIGFIVSLVIFPFSINLARLLSQGEMLFILAGALSALTFQLILAAKPKESTKTTQFIVPISLILLIFSDLTVQAQSTEKPKTTPKKLTGWVVKVTGIEGLRSEYVVFNSKGVGFYYRSTMLGVTGYQRPPAIGTGLLIGCTFNLSEKLVTETKSAMSGLRPQNWKEGYGKKVRFLRSTVTYFYSDRTSTVYETVWRVTEEMPNDLRKILILRDKVFDERNCR